MRCYRGAVLTLLTSYKISRLCSFTHLPLPTLILWSIFHLLIVPYLSQHILQGPSKRSHGLRKVVESLIVSHSLCGKCLAPTAPTAPSSHGPKSAQNKQPDSSFTAIPLSSLQFPCPHQNLILSGARSVNHPVLERVRRSFHLLILPYN